MKFKDYLNSLVSRRKSSASSSKPSHHPTNKKHQQESTTLADCHYDICGYEDINSVMPDDLHSRTQILLARHADLVNTIVETRSSQDNSTPSCSQCRLSHQPSPMIPSLPPPLPPKLSFEQQTSFSNRNYSSTLATCSPRRECQQPPYYQKNLTSSQYSTPNPSVISSSSSLWTTTASLSKKQRSRIRTNPWIGKTSIYNRPSIRAESSRVFHHQTSPIESSLHPEYSIYDPTFNKSPSTLIHSESFPQTTLNGNTHVITPPNLPPPPEPAPTSSVILHQSDSGQGFSLASSRVINSLSSSSSSPPSSSSSPDDTSVDGILSNEKQHYRQKKLTKKISSTSPLVIKNSPKRNINTEQNFCSNTISSDSGSLTRRKKANQISPSVSVQYRYQRPSGITKTTPVKLPIDQIHNNHHSLSSSSHSIDDHFSLEFEEILENERSHKHRKDKQPSTKRVSPTSISPSKSPFILPLEETNIKLSSPPPSILFSPTLAKTNSRAILKHIEEIENEIRLIKNLDLAKDDDGDDDEYVFSPHAYPEEDIDLEDENDNDAEEVAAIKDERQSIYDQVDQWVEKCLTTTKNTDNPSTLLHTECDRLSNTIKDYVGRVCSDNDRQTSSIPTPQATTKLMTAFYLSSISPKRTSSFNSEPFKLKESQTGTQNIKTSIHECPF